MGKAPCCEKVGLKRGRWTAEEDQILANYIAEHGEGSWRSLPKNAGLLRCGKSCRLRWMNYLRAGVKRGNISREEEDTIIKLHATLGNRWSMISSHLPGRTDNEIKNHWNSHLSRQIHTYHRKYTSRPDTAITIDMSKRRSAHTRRSGRTPGQSPKSATSSSKQPDPEPEPESGDAKGAFSPSPPTAATSAARSDGPRPGSGSEGPRSEDATGPWMLETIELEDLWKAESEIDALLMSIDDAALEGFDAVGGEGQVDDLLDIDMDWDGFAFHLWGVPEQNDQSAELQQAAEPQAPPPAAAAACTPDENELQAAAAAPAAPACTSDEHELEAQVLDDLFDMDWDWGGFWAHLWGGPEKNDHSAELQQAAERQAAAAPSARTPDERELDAFETWLLSDLY